MGDRMSDRAPLYALIIVVLFVAAIVGSLWLIL